MAPQLVRGLIDYIVRKKLSSNQTYAAYFPDMRPVFWLSDVNPTVRSQKATPQIRTNLYTEITRLHGCVTSAFRTVFVFPICCLGWP